MHIHCKYTVIFQNALNTVCSYSIHTFYALFVLAILHNICKIIANKDGLYNIVHLAWLLSIVLVVLLLVSICITINFMIAGLQVN